LKANNILVDNAGVEPAANWLFAHMDDAQYDLPVQSKSNGNTNSSTHLGFIS